MHSFFAHSLSLHSIGVEVREVNCENLEVRIEESILT